MPSSKLYVIGNGFDLWHGIPSSLAEFKRYMQSADLDVYREVEEYLPVGEDWCDLEKALAELDTDMLTDNLGHFMASYGADDWSDSGHHDFQYEVGNVVKRLSTDLQRQFAVWVRKLPVPTRDNFVRRLLQLDRQALYLTFNYTDTLNTLYGINIEQVLFIHGCATKPHDELVLGHAWAPQVRRSLNDRSDIEEVDTRQVEANNIIDDYFSATFKNSEEIISQHSRSFDALNSIDQVIVLGHSLSSVDGAYFHALREQPSIAVAQWYIAVRTPEEWMEKQQLLTSFGVKANRVTPVLWENL